MHIFRYMCAYLVRVFVMNAWILYKVINQPTCRCGTHRIPRKEERRSSLTRNLHMKS